VIGRKGDLIDEAGCNGFVENGRIVRSALEGGGVVEAWERTVKGCWESDGRVGDGGVGGVEWCSVLCVDSDLKLFLLASGTLQASGISAVGEGAYIQERCALSVRRSLTWFGLRLGRDIQVEAYWEYCSCRRSLFPSMLVT